MRVISLSTQPTFHKDEPTDPIKRVIFYLQQYALDPRIVLHENKTYVSQSKEGDWYTWGRLDKLSFVFNLKGTREELEDVIQAIEANTASEAYLEAYKRVDDILQAEQEAVLARLRAKIAATACAEVKERDACERAMVLPAKIARWRAGAHGRKIYEQEIETPVGRVLVMILGRAYAEVSTRRDGIHPMAQGLTLGPHRLLPTLKMRASRDGSWNLDELEDASSSSYTVFSYKPPTRSYEQKGAVGKQVEKPLADALLTQILPIIQHFLKTNVDKALEIERDLAQSQVDFNNDSIARAKATLMRLETELEPWMFRLEKVTKEIAELN